MPDSGSLTLNGFGFAGEQVDPETGFVYLRHRSYDPTTSRYLTPDPLGALGSGVNLYAYVGNNPVIGADPSGLDGKAEGGAAEAEALGGTDAAMGCIVSVPSRFIYDRERLDGRIPCLCQFP